MSTVSFLQADRSDLLAKRFAYLASTYFDHPEDAREPAAKIPLENLFRMLQMFRYDAFSDEPRSGVLELRGLDQHCNLTGSDQLWHQQIESALKTALAEAFGNTPKGEAIENVQSVLAWLAVDGPAPSDDVRTRSRKFLERFLAALG